MRLLGSIKIIRCSNFAVFREWEALRVSGSIFSVNSTTGGQHEREHFYNGDLNTGSNIFARFPIYRLVFFSSLRLVFHLFFYSISSCCDEIVGSINSRVKCHRAESIHRHLPLQQTKHRYCRIAVEAISLQISLWNRWTSETIL